MQKKLLAMAVAGALAIPGAALAASSVTITGFFKVSYALTKVSNQAVVGARDNQDRVEDESSRIYFRVVEDLGGGLQAIGQVDWRVQMDNGGSGAAGANWVGLRSKSWGEIGLGRYDLHYIYTEDQTYSRGGSLKMTNTSIISFAGGGGIATANATRTPNTVRWFSPNWKGFTAVVAYSASPFTASESDLGSTTSKGSAWNIAPQYNAKNWGIGYSYWKGKTDAVGAGGANDERRGDRFNGHYQWGGLRVGFVYDKAKHKNMVTGAQTSKRNAWSIPVRYDWGKNSIFAHYSQADDDKNLQNGQAVTGNSGADMWSLGYAYSFSKRTKVAFSYAKIDNDTFANYNLFTNATGSLGSPSNAVAAGQDPQNFAITVTHNF
jgi:predicted porin